ncbi:PDZ domain-containing RING finger protein 4 [Triplophysa dalaica]|uniref:PDZ domain-containing RING finger protein 4 n=1 Tax=Triplophysa dalaica TaxID=1582913 RepID=UPI0024DFAA73|nr:PDZ domain-containing RING finger protein 4 [Triplophysa dalaica]XP_056604661.1 PDZ domain-containing RING finger protein 4 [Triplophysa dalaica]
MGCNLCTLQKREEHYKLLYEIAQVNGREYSKSGHDGTVEAMRKDPIVVQVLRRGQASRNQSSLQEVCVVDVCTQTDITFEHIMALAKMRPSTPPVPDICPFLLSDSCHSIQTVDHEYFDCPEYVSSTQAEVERADEFECEEVELCRMNSQEKLGLTLCYRTDEDEDAAIFVGQVEPNSLAARDGRIKEGDRILQINGHDVQDKEEAVALLSNDNSRSIVLLVTRPEGQMDGSWLDEDHHDFLEELKMEILEGKKKEGIYQTVSRMKQSKRLEEQSTDTATCSSGIPEKDSGVKCSFEEDSEHELSHSQTRTQHQLLERWEAGSRLVPMDTMSFGRQEPGQDGMMSENGVECDQFQQLLELKCQIRNGGECGLVYRRSSTIECSLTDQGGSGVARELHMLNEELRNIERECQSIMQAHQLRRSKHDSPRTDKENRLRRCKLADINEHPERLQWEKLRDKDSSSAYNTAESSRSTPLGTEGSPDLSVHRRVHLTNQKNLRSTQNVQSPYNSQYNSPILSFPSQSSSAYTRAHTYTSSTPPLQTPMTSPGSQGPCQAFSSSLEQSPSNPSESDPALPADDEHCERNRSRASATRHYPSPYHSNTAPTQTPGTRHYQSYLQLLQQHSTSSLEYSQSQLSLLSLRGRPGPAQSGRVEWKVKVRADGTRYVARRPARDRILRERALRIREERSGGMTTDDDAVSELKMGRYWSKEERKQQLARAREQRRRREFMQRSRLECLKETVGTASGEVSILELSHKKMLKKRNKKILDNWMTIQELMSHGARAPEGTKVHNAFLSVTTV